MKNTTIIGIDLAKRVFQLHGMSRTGKRTFAKRLRRCELLPFLNTIQPTIIAIEACCGSHYWARTFKQAGHEVKIIHPAYVKPFVRVNKNDSRDAEAIAEAASRDSTPLVVHKSSEQLDLQALHRVRERLVRERVSIGNELRGLLAEHGVVIATGDKAIRHEVPSLLEDADTQISDRCRMLIDTLRQEWLGKFDQVDHYDRQLHQIVKTTPACTRLMSIPGIGPIIATLLYSYAGDAKHYRSSRHLAASLGLVPRQHSSGGREQLLGISKKGNKYLRKQLVHGARSAYKVLKSKPEQSRLGRWLEGMRDKHPNKVIVALANKLARIAWVCLTKEQTYMAA